MLSNAHLKHHIVTLTKRWRKHYGENGLTLNMWCYLLKEPPERILEVLDELVEKERWSPTWCTLVKGYVWRPHTYNSTFLGRDHKDIPFDKNRIPEIYEACLKSVEVIGAGAVNAGKLGKTNLDYTLRRLGHNYDSSYIPYVIHLKPNKKRPTHVAMCSLCKQPGLKYSRKKEK